MVKVSSILQTFDNLPVIHIDLVIIIHKNEDWKVFYFSFVSNLHCFDFLYFGRCEGYITSIFCKYKLGPVWLYLNMTMLLKSKEQRFTGHVIDVTCATASKGVILRLWSQTGNITFSWELVRTHILSLPARPPESETLVVGPGVHCNQPFRWSHIWPSLRITNT